MKNLKFLSLLIALLAIGCSPYATQFSSLDAAYARGEITGDRYYAEKGRLTALDQQWRSNMAQSMNTFNQNMQQTNQQHHNRIQEIMSESRQSQLRQEEINAYNQRTQMLSQPQRINLNHSGTINHNVYGY